MEKNEMLCEIMKQIQKKYSCVSEIHRLTEEVGTSLSRDDRVSVQMILAMRQDEMNASDECDKSIELLIESLQIEEQCKVRELLKLDDINEADSIEGKKIIEIKRNIRMILERCVQLDKAMSTRVAGKDSFYSY
ncbi:MAG: hypothetical protein PHX08_19845 [Lachnospiraceae bacterium]|nr:hypothetical protein [Lachnospiraceae bacterium]